MEMPRNNYLVEILLRLPVKSLLRFKCVSKHWYSLIGSPSFIKEHFLSESNRERQLIWHYKPDEERYAYALYVGDHISSSGYQEPDHLQVLAEGTTLHLMGPSNGVFCLRGNWRRAAFFNPATRQFRPLPTLTPDVPPHFYINTIVNGFGLDPLSEDYKLVCVQSFINEEIGLPHYPCLVSVYSSGSDSWRHFEDVDLVNSSCIWHDSLCNTYLNGVYYWLTDSYNLNNVIVAVFILAFDMSNEKFRLVQAPDCIIPSQGDLTLYGDSLALLLRYNSSNNETGKCIDIWVMEKEGCWSKSLTVGPFQDIRWPLGFFWNNNELLLETETLFLTAYNIHTQKLTTVGVRRTVNDFFGDLIFSYKESLVSIKGEGDKCMLWDPSSDFIKDFLRATESSTII